MKIKLFAEKIYSNIIRYKKIRLLPKKEFIRIVISSVFKILFPYSSQKFIGHHIKHITKMAGCHTPSKNIFRIKQRITRIRRAFVDILKKREIGN